MLIESNRNIVEISTYVICPSGSASSRGQHRMPNKIGDRREGYLILIDNFCLSCCPGQETSYGEL